jgi:hypothetical protein
MFDGFLRDVRDGARLRATVVDGFLFRPRVSHDPSALVDLRVDSTA